MKVGGGGGRGFPLNFVQGRKYKSLGGTLHLLHLLYFMADLGLKGLPDYSKCKLVPSLLLLDKKKTQAMSLFGVKNLFVSEFVRFKNLFVDELVR
jgi:hypothetical protein